MTWILFLVALGGGVANPFQSGTNAQLNKVLAQPVWATIVVYALGLASLLFVQLFVREPIPLGQAHGVPWWAWLGAPISLVSTFVALSIAQKMGSGLFTGATVTASLVTSVLLDHFGLIGFKQHPASVTRVCGCGLMVVGLWLIAKF